MLLGSACALLALASLYVLRVRTLSSFLQRKWFPACHFFFRLTFTFQLLNKLWSQVSSLLPTGTCLPFLSRIGFSIPTARRRSSHVANSRFRAFRESICAQEKVPTYLVYTSIHSMGLELTIAGTRITCDATSLRNALYMRLMYVMLPAFHMIYTIIRTHGLQLGFDVSSRRTHTTHIRRSRKALPDP